MASYFLSQGFLFHHLCMEMNTPLRYQYNSPRRSPSLKATVSIPACTSWLVVTISVSHGQRRSNNSVACCLSMELILGNFMGINNGEIP